MSNTEQSPVVWTPDQDTLTRSRMGQFKAWLEQQGFGRSPNQEFGRPQTQVLDDVGVSAGVA